MLRLLKHKRGEQGFAGDAVGRGEYPWFGLAAEWNVGATNRSVAVVGIQVYKRTAALVKYVAYSIRRPVAVIVAVHHKKHAVARLIAE